MAFNLRAKASMREFLRSKTWEEKGASIERMNAAGRKAREGMRKATMARQAMRLSSEPHKEKAENAM